MCIHFEIFKDAKVWGTFHCRYTALCNIHPIKILIGRSSVRERIMSDHKAEKCQVSRALHGHWIFSAGERGTCESLLRSSSIRRWVKTISNSRSNAFPDQKKRTCNCNFLWSTRYTTSKKTSQRQDNVKCKILSFLHGKSNSHIILPLKMVYLTLLVFIFGRVRHRRGRSALLLKSDWDFWHTDHKEVRPRSHGLARTRVKPWRSCPTALDPSSARLQNIST